MAEPERARGPAGRAEREERREPKGAAPAPPWRTEFTVRPRREPEGGKILRGKGRGGLREAAANGRARRRHVGGAAGKIEAGGAT